MPSSRRQKSKAKPAAHVRRPATKRPARAPPRKTASSKPAAKSGGKASRPASPQRVAKAKEAPVIEMPTVRRSDGRAHVLSLSFVRDGDEFLARMETDAGQITELKNRSLDQLLTLVASELEDLLE